MMGHTPRQIRTVFVGSTVKDLGEHRDNVHNALMKKGVAAFLNEEHWNVSFRSVETECRDRLAASDGYLGIFAHWHGWVPEGQDRSITALEFEWAFARWGEKALCHMAVFMPEDGCDEDRKLCIIADKLHLDEFSDNLSRNKHRRRHEEFLRDVCQYGRAINRFDSIPDLRERAIIVVSQWREEVLEASRNSSSPHPPATLWSNIDLGRLGRWKQKECLIPLINRFGPMTEMPAFCVVISGPSGHGHDVCLEYLVSAQAAKLGRVRAVTPPGDRYDVPALVRQMANCLELPGNVGTVAELAAAVAPLLENNRLVLTLERLFSLNGGLAVFQERFWAPFVEALTAETRRYRKPKKMIMFVTDVGVTEPEIGISCEDALHRVHVDPTRPITLPRLTPIVDSDVRRWLAEVGCADDDDVRDNAVKVALTGDDGQPDGTPALVYLRLAKLDLPIDEDS